jgi:hypothetical protein
MRGLSIVAIVVGGFCDVLLSGFLGAALIFHVLSTHGLNNGPKQELRNAVVSVIHNDFALYAAQLAIGFVCSAFGGFIAASIAKRRRELNGVLASWLCVGLGVGSLLFGTAKTSAVVDVGVIMVTPLCYWAGAALRARIFGKSVV